MQIGHIHRLSVLFILFLFLIFSTDLLYGQCDIDVDQSAEIRATYHSYRDVLKMTELGSIKQISPDMKKFLLKEAIYLDDIRNKNLECPGDLMLSEPATWNRGGPSGTSFSDGFNEIEKLVEKMKFDPRCISGEVDRLATFDRKKVMGFTFGAVMSATLGAGATMGTEIVIMPWGDNALMVGMVKYSGVETSVSLPAGMSVTQGVINGKCDDAIVSYLGFFNSYGVLGQLNNDGITKPVVGDYTNCDSRSLVLGTSTHAVAVSVTLYEPMGKFALVTGPRVQKMLDYIKSFNLNKKKDISISVP